MNQFVKISHEIAVKSKNRTHSSQQMQRTFVEMERHTAWYFLSLESIQPRPPKSDLYSLSFWAKLTFHETAAALVNDSPF